MKILGLVFLDKLKWDTQVNSALNKANSMLYAMRYLNRFMSRKQFKQLIHAHYLSKIMYGSQVWSRTLNVRTVDKINASFFKIMRLYCKDFDRTLHRHQLVERSELRTFTSMRIIGESKILFRLMKVAEIKYFKQQFENITYTLNRYPNEIFFRKVHTRREGQQGITYRAKFVAELIPFEWRNLSVESFDRKINQCTPRFMLGQDG